MGERHEYIQADFREGRMDLRHIEDLQFSIQRVTVTVLAFGATAAGLALTHQPLVLLPLLLVLPLILFALGTMSLRIFLLHDRMTAYVWIELPGHAVNAGVGRGIWTYEESAGEQVSELAASTFVLKRFPGLLMPLLYSGTSLLPGYGCLAAASWMLIADDRTYVAHLAGMRWLVAGWIMLNVAAYVALTVGLFRVDKVRDRVRASARRHVASDLHLTGVDGAMSSGGVAH